MADSTSKVTIDFLTRGDWAAMDQGREKLSGFAKQVEVFQQTLVAGLGLGGGALLANGIIQGVSKIKELVTSAFEDGKSIENFSRQLGTSAEATQVLGIAAEQTGTDLEKLVAANSKLNVALAASRVQGSAAALAFQRLGLDARALEGLTVEQRLQAIGTAMLNATDKTEAYRAATELLGTRNVAQLTGLLRQLGTDGFDKMAESAEKAGMVLSATAAEMLKASEIYFKGVGRQLTVAKDNAVAAGGAVVESFAGGSWVDRLKIFLGNPGDIAATVAQMEALKHTVTDAAQNGGPQQDVTSVNALMQATLGLAQAKSTLAKAEDNLSEIDETIARIEKDGSLDPATKEQLLQKYYEQQADALYRKSDALQAVYFKQVQINALESKGFKLGADNTAGAVSERDVTNLQPGQSLTPEQEKGLTEKAAREKGISDTSKQSRQTLIASGDNNKAQAGQGLSGNLGAVNSEMIALENRWGTLTKQIAAGIGTTVASIDSSFSTMLQKLVNGTATATQAIRGFFASVGASMLKTVTDMAAHWVTEHTVMAAVSAIFGAREVATHHIMEVAKTSSTVAGEGARTGATAAGSAERGSISLSETIFHVVQVAIRTTAHVLGEALRTAATVAQSAIRVAVMIGEAIVNVIQASVEGLAAMASIPYVGPILGIAAMGAILAAGMAIVGHRAQGGDVQAGRPYVVGEYRPEVFVPNTSGTIMPRLGDMSGGAGRAMGSGGGAGGAGKASSTPVYLHMHQDSMSALKAAAKTREGRALIVDITRGTVRQYTS